MSLPSSGTLTLNDIQNEFGGSNPIGLSEYYRGGTYVPNSPLTTTIPTSGTIAVSNFYGTSKRIQVASTITGPTTDYNVYTNRSPFYISGITDLTVTVNSGVSVGSTSNGSYAMLVPSEFSPTDTVTIVNNGTIQGAGGPGGPGGFAVRAFNPFSPTVSPGSPGRAAGSAIYVNRPTTIYNNNVIAGGGGGGAGGAGSINFGPITSAFGGGGGGGGAGFSVAGTGGTGGPATNLIGNTTPGSPGSPGTASAGGAGGPGGPGAGGPGGGLGSAGTSVGPVTGGAAGNYIVGNGFVTWAATGTRYGGVA
jgi:hypothetical protein